MASSFAPTRSFDRSLSLPERWARGIGAVFARVALLEVRGVVARVSAVHGLTAAIRGREVSLVDQTPFRWSIEAASPIVGAGTAPGGSFLTTKLRLGVAPRAYAIVPLVVRRRLVALAYADCGGQAMPIRAVGELFEYCDRALGHDPKLTETRIIVAPKSTARKIRRATGRRPVLLRVERVGPDAKAPAGPDFSDLFTLDAEEPYEERFRPLQTTAAEAQALVHAANDDPLPVTDSEEAWTHFVDELAFKVASEPARPAPGPLAPVPPEAADFRAEPIPATNPGPVVDLCPAADPIPTVPAALADPGPAANSLPAALADAALRATDLHHATPSTAVPENVLAETECEVAVEAVVSPALDPTSGAENRDPPLEALPLQTLPSPPTNGMAPAHALSIAPCGVSDFDAVAEPPNNDPVGVLPSPPLDASVLPSPPVVEDSTSQHRWPVAFETPDASVRFPEEPAEVATALEPCLEVLDVVTPQARERRPSRSDSDPRTPLPEYDAPRFTASVSGSHDGPVPGALPGEPSGLWSPDADPGLGSHERRSTAPEWVTPEGVVSGLELTLRRRWVHAFGGLGLAAGLLLLMLPLRPAGAGEEAERIVEIPPALNVPEIARLLEDQGLIQNARAFQLLARVSGLDRSLRAGTYRIPVGAWAWSVLWELHEGQVRTVTVTVPEGLSLREVAELLDRRGVNAAPAVLAAAREARLLERFEIPGETVEGYLFPETYTFARGLPATELLATMVEEFFLRLYALPKTEDLSSRALHERVILASIVEKEVRLVEEAPRVAGVFQNRLDRYLRLESCATVQYILGKPKDRLRLSDLRVPSPYNTYLRPGLPPGPIANPGIAALRAVLEPERHDYLFFVARQDGTGRHIFTETFAAHERAQRDIRLRQRAGK